MIDNRFGINDLIVFIDAQQLDRVASVRKTLESMPTVRGLSFVSQDDALAEFQCLFKKVPKSTADVSK